MLVRLSSPLALFIVWAVWNVGATMAAAESSTQGLPPVIHVKEHGQVARSGFPVTGAVPLSRGALSTQDVPRLTLRAADGQPVPLQADITGCWPDGSVKWLLLDFPVNVAARGEARFTLARANDTPQSAPMGQAAAGGVRVDTGAIVARFADGRLAIHRSGENGAAVLEDLVSHIETVDRHGQRRHHALTMGQASLELNGSQRAVVKVEGWHTASSGNDRYSPSVIRFVFYRDQALVRVYHTFVVSADPNDTLIGDVSLRLRLAGTMDRATIQNRAVDRALPVAGTVSVFQENRYVPTYPGHYKAKEFQGHFVVTAAVAGRDRTVVSGERYGGGMTLSGPEGGVSVFIKDFWQLSPKALAYDPADGELYVGLYPGRFTDPLDLMRISLREPPHWKDYVRAESNSWGKFSPTYVPVNLAHSAMGMSRTHEVVLRFDQAGTTAGATELARLFSVPTVPFVSGRWNMETGAVGQLVAPDQFPDIEQITTRMTDQIARSIEDGGWYGLMTYGNVRYGWDRRREQWMKYCPKFGWFNGGHMIYGGTLQQVLWHQYLRSGRPDDYVLADARSRQVQDLAVVHYHTDQIAWWTGEAHVPSTVAGTMVRHGGPEPWMGTRNDHGGHSPLLGTPLHYYVTGYQRAADVTHFVAQKIYQARDFNHTRVMDTDITSMVAYYQFSGDERYLERAREYIDYYYRTRQEAAQEQTYFEYYATAMRLAYEAIDDPQVRQQIRATYLMRYHQRNSSRGGVGSPEMAALAWQLDPTPQHTQWLRQALAEFRRGEGGSVGVSRSLQRVSGNDFPLATGTHYALRQWQQATAGVDQDFHREEPIATAINQWDFDPWDDEPCDCHPLSSERTR